MVRNASCWTGGYHFFWFRNEILVGHVVSLSLEFRCEVQVFPPPLQLSPCCSCHSALAKKRNLGTNIWAFLRPLCSAPLNIGSENPETEHIERPLKFTKLQYHNNKGFSTSIRTHPISSLSWTIANISCNIPPQKYKYSRSDLFPTNPRVHKKIQPNQARSQSIQPARVCNRS